MGDAQKASPISLFGDFFATSEPSGSKILRHGIENRSAYVYNAGVGPLPESCQHIRESNNQ
jgi:hypothetical protein